MTTHELAKLLLEQPDVELFINDDEVSAPYFEEIVTTDLKKG